MEIPTDMDRRAFMAWATGLLADTVVRARVQPAQRTSQYTDWVEPRVDTHNSRWIYFSSACRPFGMVNLSPDTRLEGDWGAGYIYGEPFIRCFSHIHDWQLAGIPVMPATGVLRGHEGYEAYKASFSHADEVVKPGYHRVRLQNYGITAELTSTMRVGFHRYLFPATENAYVYFDAGAALSLVTMQDALIRRLGSSMLAGFSTMAPTIRRPKPCTVYFVAEFDRPFDEFGGWEAPDGDAKSRRLLRNSVNHFGGPQCGGYVRFRLPDARAVQLKVAISYVSEEGAKSNLRGELPGWDFDAVVRDSSDEWNDWLGKVEVEGGTAKQRKKFYTDLWHALLGRRTFSDLNGQYVDNTGPEPRVRAVPLDRRGSPTRNTYNSDAFWGTWWNLNILWSLAYPQTMNDMAASLLEYYFNGGTIARGPSGGNYTFVMVGDQATPLIVAAYNKGIRNFDIEAAYQGCRKNAFPGGIRDRGGYEFGPNPQGGGMNYYIERGYVPMGIGGEAYHRDGAGQTVEYAYQDWCLAQFAKALGREEDYELFLHRSGNWRKLFDSSTGWIRPRNMDGSWYAPFQPVCGSAACPGFVESDAAIATYFVPQDIAGLIEALGGPEQFVKKLNGQFERSVPYHFEWPTDRHPDTWMDYGNEPSGHLAHLFSHAGAPWLTQYWVRRVKEEAFGDISPFGGYNGDEDQGQLGGLGVLMAIGLFDIQGGASIQPRYEITSPIFDRVTIHLDSRYYPGRVFTIVTRHNRPGNIYIQSARLNGKPLSGRFWITHAEFVAGGTLEIQLGPMPNKQWGVG
jgi:predicted alpha-1,2-mannosidase